MSWSSRILAGLSTLCATWPYFAMAGRRRRRERLNGPGLRPAGGQQRKMLGSFDESEREACRPRASHAVGVAQRKRALDHLGRSNEVVHKCQESTTGQSHLRPGDADS